MGSTVIPYAVLLCSVGATSLPDGLSGGVSTQRASAPPCRTSCAPRMLPRKMTPSDLTIHPRC